MKDKELAMKLDRARWWLLREHPFYGTLAMGLVDIIDDKVPTACTNGRVIRWNPTFLEGLSDQQARFVVLHETGHCAHGHLWRLPATKRGNMAADYAINGLLSSIPGLEMPTGGLVCPPEWKNLAEEEILMRLPDDQDGGGGNGQDKGTHKGSGCGDFEEPAEDGEGEGDPSNQPGEGEDGESTVPGTVPEAPLKEEWERRVIQAKQVADATKGTLPADLQRVLDRVKHQPLDWRREMADFVKNIVSTRNDWSRSDRRHAWQSVIYPRKKAEDMGVVVFARDTSGSISGQLCAEFSAHITSALAEVGCRGLVLDCDAEIQDEIWLAQGEECPLTAKGGGGTSHRPIWDRVSKLADDGEIIAGIVCLTDLYTDFPEGDGGHSTLWLSTSGLIAPFGRTVRIES